jgi:signal transduction histidine kinase
MEEKLRVVGRLTRHDVRNKLSAVTANTYLLKKRLGGDSEALERLSDVECAVRETTQIFDFARTYEKLGIEKLVYIDVEKTFNGAVQQFSDLQVKVVNDCSGLSVLADSLLTRLFYNLIDNSLKHGENVSKIRVYYIKAGQNQLKLVYEDNGVGIRKAEKLKIFREGYGKDTGYGLYLIMKMCQVYGWTIRETGKHDEGARFTMTIPGTNSNGKTCYQLSRNK